MQTIKVKKAELIAKLKSNREAHRAVFLEALEGYRKTATRELEKRLEMLKAGKRFSVYLSLAEPTDQTRDYDRAIAMLEMSLGEEAALTEADFASYVQDDWAWKNQFLTSNASYSHTAAAMLAQRDGAEEN